MVVASKPVEELTPFGHALAGALGGVFSNAVVYPLDTAKTRIQANSEAGKGKGKAAAAQISIVSTLLRILREEGIAGYYKGFGASMLNTFSMQYAYFFFYSFVRGSYLRRLAAILPPGSNVPTLSTAAELIIGAVAGALAQIFTIPVSVIATRQQLGNSRTQRDLNTPEPYPKDDSFLAVAKEIIREDGVQGLWLGLGPSLVLTVNPAITYGVFERIKSLVLGGNTSTKLTPWRAFLLGALSKTLATIITYPYIMAKVRIQAGTGLEEETLPLNTQNGKNGDVSKRRPHKGGVSALAVLAKVLREQGPLGWYQGMGAQITKAVLSQALLFMSKDQFERYALLIMILVRRLRPI